MPGRDTFVQTAKGTPFDNSTNGFVSTKVQPAIEEVQSIAAPLRVPINLVYNGTLSNGDFIGYSNLLPGDTTPIVSPIAGTLFEFTWSNKNTSADFNLEFRLDSTTATPFYTWSATNAAPQAVLIPTPEPITLGQQVYIKYVDQGSNAQDATIVLLFKA